MKDFLHHLFLPRESNNHRSKLLHHDSLILAICLLFFVSSLFAVVHNTHPDVLGVSSNISNEDLLSLTNQRRQENGLPPLKMNSELTQAAQQKAAHMFANNYWAHIAPDGTTPWYFIKNSGYEYLYAGENLARGFTTAPDVVSAWMASPSHRENMLSKNYNDVGFAVQSGSLTGSDTILVVEELGSLYTGKTEVKTSDTSSISPTPAVVAEVTTVPSPTVLPTAMPTPVLKQDTVSVAAVQNKPLIDSRSITQQIALGALFLFIAVLIIDAIIIERNKIARVVSHNLDHILFLIIIALIVIILKKGFIL